MGWVPARGPSSHAWLKGRRPVRREAPANHRNKKQAQMEPSAYSLELWAESALGVAAHWHSRVLGFYPSALARKPSKSPGRPDSSPLDPGKPSFFFGEVNDISPGLEGRVGDQVWHP